MGEAGFNISIIGVGILLLAYLIYNEAKRPNLHWRSGRVLASLVLVLCLVCLAIPLSYPVEESLAKDELTILTKGFQKDSIKANTKQIYLDADLDNELKKEAAYVPDLGYYLAANPTIKQINVYGYGLGTDDLQKTENHRLQFYPSALPNGVMDCSWTDEVMAEEDFVVQGKYNNTSTKPLLLKLNGYGVALDSIKISAKTIGQFSLQHQIKQTGNALMNLVAVDGKDTIANELLPFKSTPKNLVKTLMLAAYPSFETKFIKKWLYQNGYPLAFRSEISKAKYSVDFLNRSAAIINQLSTALLKNEDLIIIDYATYNKLSSTEKSALNNSISQGLGLILLVDEETPSPIWQTKLLKLDSQQKDLMLSLASSQQRLPTLQQKQQLFISANENQQALVTDQQKKAIAIQQIFGEGKVVISTFAQSYEWELMGKKQDYANYWSALISAATRKQKPVTELIKEDRFAQSNEKMTFQIKSANNSIPKLSINNVDLNITQNLLFPNSWRAETWNNKIGWNTAKINQTAHQFYVFDKENWTTLKAAKNIENNLKAIKIQSSSSEKNLETTVKTKKEISKWYFVIGFVLAASFLWFEGRVYAKV